VKNSVGVCDGGLYGREIASIANQNSQVRALTMLLQPRDIVLVSQAQEGVKNRYVEFVREQAAYEV